ncbi:MAG: hypothetical protein QM401_02555 [Bacillota bacterium]|nr:hypothetical protein [Bacillota bacterium]
MKIVHALPGLTSTATIKQKIMEIITLPEEVIDNLCIPEDKKTR